MAAYNHCHTFHHEVMGFKFYYMLLVGRGQTPSHRLKPAHTRCPHRWSTWSGRVSDKTINRWNVSWKDDRKRWSESRVGSKLTIWGVLLIRSIEEEDNINPVKEKKTRLRGRSNFPQGFQQHHSISMAMPILGIAASIQPSFSEVHWTSHHDGRYYLNQPKGANAEVLTKESILHLVCL